MAAFASQAIERGNRHYASTVMKAPVLEKEHEFDLARRWREDRAGDKGALRKYHCVACGAEAYRSEGPPDRCLKGLDTPRL